MKILRHICARGRGPDSTGPLADVESQIEERNRRAIAVCAWRLCVRGGKSFICLSSAFEKGDIRKSRIVPGLMPGKYSVHHPDGADVCLDGVRMVNLKGRARPGSVAIADPDFRANLDKKRACMALIRRTVYLVIFGPAAHVNQR